MFLYRRQVAKSLCTHNQRFFNSSSKIVLQQHLSKETQIFNTNASKSEEIKQRLEELEQKTRRIKSKQQQEYEQFLLEEKKPHISDFYLPLFTTFVIATSVYLALQWIYVSLEKDEKLKEYQDRVTALELDIQTLLDKNGSGSLQKKDSKWFSWLWK